MADKAQELIDAVIARLQNVLVANGYSRDFGLNVTDEPEALFETDAPDEMVCAYIDLLEKPSDPAMRNVGRLTHVAVVVKGTAGQGNRQASQVAMLADMDRVMADRTGWPTGVTAPEFQEAKFINRAEGLPWVGVAIRYSSHITRPRA